MNVSRRLWALCVIVAVLFGILAIRLVDLQVLRGSYFTAVAASQRQRSAELTPTRGTIYFTDGHRGELFPVASNQTAAIVYAVPRDMSDPYSAADALAPALHAFQTRQRQRVNDILNRTGQNRAARGDAAAQTPSPAPEPSADEAIALLREQLYQKFNQRTDPYEPLLKPYEVLDQDLQQFLEERQLPGLHIAQQERRVYPEGELAAHVLGYVGWSEAGQTGRYGVEEYFNSQLSGDLGWLFSERDHTGQFIGVGESNFRPPTDGQDIVLTIDRVVQSIIEDELESGVTKYGADRGSVTVMNPKTGAILGMATFPTFDPNYYYAISEASVQANPVVADIFEPGSIIKPVVMAAAIEEGKVTPKTTMVDSGPVKVDKYTINTFDNKHHGLQTMTQVLEQSNNIGMVWVGQQLGREKLYDYARRFGFGEQTGLELATETKTSLPAPSDWNVATIATVSFGQGIAVTPLQALNAINAIANRGVLMQPYITANRTPTSVRQVVSAHTAAQVSAMMVSVIENGVATLAQVPGYYLAGKTGTAQVPDDRGKYSPDRKIISFVGFGPVDDPQFSILIKLDNPDGLSFASGTAAPMFKNIAEKLLNYYQVPPDYEATQKQPKFEVPLDPKHDAA